MGRSPACKEKVLKVKKGPWTPDEDRKLLAYIQNHGHGSWPALPSKAGLRRCGKSCRLRWINYLRPDIKRGNFSMEEEQTIIQLHALLGNRWSVIATHLPKRTDNEIKNYWNTRIKKTLAKSGIDPITHKRILTHGGLLSSGMTKDASNLNHMAQWETARLEAEARLSTRRSKTLSNKYPYQVQHYEYQKSSAHDQLVGMPALISSPPQPQQPLCLDVLNMWQRLIMSSNEAFDRSVEHYSPASAFSFIDSEAHVPPSGQMTSISNFLDNDALSTYPTHVDQINCANNSSACDQSMLSVKQNIQNDSKILIPNNSTNLRDIKEMMENPIKLQYRDEMTKPVSCFIDSFTSNFTESCGGDSELDNWNSVLSNLANYSANGLPT